MNISVWLHIVAACAWVGGMIFMAAVVVPTTRALDDRRLAADLIQAVGRRFRILGWASLAMLILTGMVNLHFRGIGVTQLTDGTFWASAYGTRLAYKLALVAVILALSVYHDFSMGPRALSVMRDQPGSPEALRVRKLASVFGRLNMLLALVVVGLAVTLVRGC